MQTIITEEMPKTSDAVTALSKYVIGLIILAAIGIIESVVVEHLFTTKAANPPPNWLMNLLRKVPTIDSKSQPRVSMLGDRKRSNCPLVQNHHQPQPNRYFHHRRVASPMANFTVPIKINTNRSFDNQSRRNSYIQAVQQHSPTTTLSGDDDIPMTSSQSINIEISVRVTNADGATMLHQTLTPEWQNNVMEDMTPAVNPFNPMARRKTMDMTHYEVSNAKQWMLVAMKMDTITFSICLFSVIAIPIVLFIPLLDFSGECNDHIALTP